MAWFSRNSEPGAMFHSDRVRQYCSDYLKRVIAELKMQGSMSRKRDCRDNPPTESL
jgi:transposase InsO family protein